MQAPSPYLVLLFHALFTLRHSPSSPPSRTDPSTPRTLSPSPLLSSSSTSFSPLSASPTQKHILHAQVDALEAQVSVLLRGNPSRKSNEGQESTDLEVITAQIRSEVEEELRERLELEIGSRMEKKEEKDKEALRSAEQEQIRLLDEATQQAKDKAEASKQAEEASVRTRKELVEELAQARGAKLEYESKVRDLEQRLSAMTQAEGDVAQSQAANKAKEKQLSVEIGRAAHAKKEAEDAHSSNIAMKKDLMAKLEQARRAEEIANKARTDLAAEQEKQKGEAGKLKDQRAKLETATKDIRKQRLAMTVKEKGLAEREGELAKDKLTFSSTIRDAEGADERMTKDIRKLEKEKAELVKRCETAEAANEQAVSTIGNLETTIQQLQLNQKPNITPADYFLRHHEPLDHSLDSLIEALDPVDPGDLVGCCDRYLLLADGYWKNEGLNEVVASEIRTKLVDEFGDMLGVLDGLKVMEGGQELTETLTSALVLVVGWIDGNFKGDASMI